MLPRTADEALEVLARAALPEPVVGLVARLESLGHEAVLVGGWVRDVLLGRPPSGDFDVATSARPEEVIAAFRRTIPTGIAHGTVTVLLRGGVRVEVTTYRGEGAYRDGRRPEKVAFHGDLHADLARRDFTVNAFAYAPTGRRFVDAFGGLEDLAARRLRAIGDPEARFREDGLRPMRAVRFCATLEFALEPATEAAIPRTLEVFDKVAAERIHDELWKLLSARRPSLGLVPMLRTGLWRRILPPPPKPADPLLARADRLPPDPVLRLAALLEAAGPEGALAAARRLKASNRDLERIGKVLDPAASELAAASEPPRIRRAAARLGRGFVEDALAFFEADDAARARVRAALDGAPLSTRELAISGRDLVREGVLAPGPAMGACLRHLLAWCIEDPTRNTRSALLAEARRHCAPPGG